ncbi:AraC family transcriptional regulator [Cohnella soli]|uniref:AraC family transcriptional regulator n=1 Tax=Cohnella soli TaxID=425005 RepID=A0ABW0I2G7_9BACL
MQNLSTLREHMPMPDPSFPIKINPLQTWRMEVGATLFPHHWHEHMEFLYVVTGHATFECGSVPYECQAGDLIVVNSNELHYGISRSEDLSYYALIMDISLLNSPSSDAADQKFITPMIENRLLFQNYIEKDSSVTDCILAIRDELEVKNVGYELSVKAHLYRMLTLLVRRYVATVRERDEYYARLKELDRLAPVLAYIDDRYKEKLTVSELADLAGLSRYHFSRLFKQVTDKSLVEYINLVRINKSESHLRDGRLTVSEIALATGFSDIYYFSRMFKKLKGVSPSEWRSDV